MIIVCTSDHIRSDHIRSLSTHNLLALGFTGQSMLAGAGDHLEKSIDMGLFARAEVGGACGHEAPRPRGFPAPLRVRASLKAARPIEKRPRVNELVWLLLPAGARERDCVRFWFCPAAASSGGAGVRPRAIGPRSGFIVGRQRAADPLAPRPRKQCNPRQPAEVVRIKLKRSGGAPVPTRRAFPGPTSSSRCPCRRP